MPNFDPRLADGIRREGFIGEELSVRDRASREFEIPCIGRPIRVL